MKNTNLIDDEPTQEEIAGEILGRFQNLEQTRITLEERMRSLVDDMQKNMMWLYEIRQEAKAAGVELE
jgi:hypothetical protein